MLGKFNHVFAALAAPFPDHQVRKRNQGGRTLSYITARLAANRLDEVLGGENWKPEYTETKDGMKCRIWFRLEPGGEWLWKEDGGGFAGMSTEDDNEKSAYSDSFKRSAVMLGVGRHLYQDGIPQYNDVESVPVPQSRQQTPGPSRPEPQRRPEPAREPYRATQGQGNPNNQGANPPRSGRALFAWTKEQEQKHEVGLLKYINGWAKLQDFPGRMVDWDSDQVAAAYQESMRKINAVTGGDDAPPPMARPEPTVTQADSEDEDIPF